jgi:hypothetical protein
MPSNGCKVQTLQGEDRAGRGVEPDGYSTTASPSGIFEVMNPPAEVA